MSRRIVYLVPFLVACGSMKAKNNVVQKHVPTVNQSMPTLPQDAEVMMIAHEFYADAQALGVEVDKNVRSISFVDTYGKCSKTVGQCEFYSNEEGVVVYKTLTLLREAWNEGSPQFKKTLLFHELGHCALNLDHTTEGSDAIMNPYVLDDETAASTWFDLVREMFSSAPSLSLDDESGDEEDECGK